MASNTSTPGQTPSRRKSVGIGATLHKRTLSGSGPQTSLNNSSSVGSPSHALNLDNSNQSQGYSMDFADQPSGVGTSGSATAFVNPPPKMGRGARRQSSAVVTLDESLDSGGSVGKAEGVSSRRVSVKPLSTPTTSDAVGFTSFDEDVESPSTDGRKKHNKFDEGTGDDDEATRNRLIRINSQLNANDIFRANQNFEHKRQERTETEDQGENDDYSEDCDEEGLAAGDRQASHNPDYIPEDDDMLTIHSPGGNHSKGAGGSRSRGPMVEFQSINTDFSAGAASRRAGDAASLMRSQSQRSASHKSVGGSTTTGGPPGGSSSTIVDSSSGVFDEVDAKIYIYLSLVQWGPMRHTFGQWRKFSAQQIATNGGTRKEIVIVETTKAHSSTTPQLIPDESADFREKEEEHESNNSRSSSALSFNPSPPRGAASGRKPNGRESPHGVISFGKKLDAKPTAVIVPALNLTKVNQMKVEDENLEKGPPPVVGKGGRVTHVVARPTSGSNTTLKNKVSNTTTASSTTAESKKPLTRQTSVNTKMSNPAVRSNSFKRQSTASPILGSSGQDKTTSGPTTAKPPALVSTTNKMTTKPRPLSHQSIRMTNPASSSSIVGTTTTSPSNYGGQPQSPAKEGDHSSSAMKLRRKSTGSHLTRASSPSSLQQQTKTNAAPLGGRKSATRREASPQPHTPKQQTIQSQSKIGLTSKPLPRVAMLGTQSAEKKKQEREAEREKEQLMKPSTPEKNSPSKPVARRGPPRCAPAPELRPSSSDILKDSTTEEEQTPPKLFRKISQLPDPELAERRSGFNVDAYSVGHHSRWGHANRRHYSGGAQGGVSNM